MPEKKKEEKPSLDVKTKRLNRFVYDERDLTEIFGEQIVKSESISRKITIISSKKWIINTLVYIYLYNTLSL